jgi:His-Xaa-Ser system protein HxsD
MANPPKNIRYSKDCVLFSINPKIYPLEVIHAAAYALIDKAYVILDGNPEEEIIAELRPKEKKEMKQIAMKFAEELLNYAVYYNQAKLNKETRETILGKVFSANVQPAEPEVASAECEVSDPLGIAKPWTPAKKKR